MYTLCSGLAQWYLSRPSISLLIIGLDNAGKTTTLERIKVEYGGQRALPSRILPTVGLNRAVVTKGGLDVVVWDLGGQTTLQTLWEKYIPDADGFIFVIDFSDTERIAEASQVLRRILAHPETHGAPLLVTANKYDVHNKNQEGVTRELDLGNLAGGRDWLVIPTSATTGVGVKEGVEWLIARCER